MVEQTVSSWVMEAANFLWNQTTWRYISEDITIKGWLHFFT